MKLVSNPAAVDAVAQSLRTLRRRVRRTSGRPLVLRLANMYLTRANVPEIEWFAADVLESSGGAVRIKIVDGWTHRRDRDEEASVVAALSRGTVDLGWVGARVFGTLGVTALDPLQAPLLFRDYSAEAAVSAGDLLAGVLEPLGGIGLSGLAVVPGEMRKPFGLTRPLVTHEDYAGAIIRTHASAVATATFRALGATPVVLSAAEMAALAPGRVDGMDLHVEAIRGWGLEGHLTFDINLWPRFTVLMASSKVFSRLGDAEQRLLRDAAQRASTKGREALARHESSDRAARPPGVEIIRASDRDIAELRERVEPVYDGLRRDPEAGGVLRELEAILSATRPAP